MVTCLMRISREKGNTGFLCRDRQILLLGPSGDHREVTVKLLGDFVKIDARFQNSKIVRVAERQLRTIREVSNEEIEENGRNYTTLRDPVIDLFEGRPYRVVNHSGTPSTQIRLQPPDDVRMEVGARDLIDED